MYNQKTKNNKAFHVSRFTFHDTRGFTLIELLVTVSIFVIITGVVLVNFPSFSSKIALDNLAHEVALAIRQAQVFGVSAREFTPGTGIFGNHGVHFDSSQNTTFFLFVDVDKNRKYTGAEELLETFTIYRRNYIGEICGYITPTSSCSILNSIDVTFVRPDPEPSILGTISGVESLYSYATITVVSPSNKTRMVTVWSNGQIAIQ